MTSDSLLSQQHPRSHNTRLFERGELTFILMELVLSEYAAGADPSVVSNISVLKKNYFQRVTFAASA